MFANDADQNSTTRIQRRSPQSWRADNRTDASEALIAAVLAIVLIGLAIVGSIALRESFVYFSDIFPM